MKPALVLALLWTCGSCARLPQANGQPAPAPPSHKRVLQALLANLDVPFSVHPSCKGVGSEFADKNLRDYVSGLLAEFVHTTGRNWITIEVKPLPPGGRAPWRCRVQFDRVDGETRLGWGVEFDLTVDGKLLRDSVICTGAG